jgi:hypothetical protein
MPQPALRCVPDSMVKPASPEYLSCTSSPQGNWLPGHTGTCRLTSAAHPERIPTSLVTLKELNISPSLQTTAVPTFGLVVACKNSPSRARTAACLRADTPGRAGCQWFVHRLQTGYLSAAGVCAFFAHGSRGVFRRLDRSTLDVASCMFETGGSPHSSRARLCWSPPTAVTDKQRALTSVFATRRWKYELTPDWSLR